METYKTLIGGSAETGPSLPLHDMDTTTLLAVAVILSGAAALVMLVARLTRRTYPGFGWWTMATGCQAAARPVRSPTAHREAETAKAHRG